MSANDLSVRVTFGLVPQAIRQHPYAVYRMFSDAVVREGTEFYAGRLALNTPVGATGKARQATVVDVEHGPATVEGHVDYAEPASGYIMFADQGTRPHWPPYAPIALWVQRVLGVLDPGIVGAIRHAISVRGTKAQKFVERTAVENQYEALGIMASAGQRAAARINAGDIR